MSRNLGRKSADDGLGVISVQSGDQELAEVLGSPARLDALRETGLLDSPPEASFDRLTRLAARILKVPVVLVSIVDDHRQFFKSSVGLPEPWACLRETPLTHSFCKHVVQDQRALIVEDALRHPFLSKNLAVSELGVAAYLGVPIVGPNGVVLGSFCVIDSIPRMWTESDLETLVDLAASVDSEIALRLEVERGTRAERLVGRFKALVDHGGDFIAMADLDAVVTYVNPAGRRLVG